ncbi:carboxylate-amine ligase YbdK [Variibacter gotjawalensis]|uniref:Putative glutamate--cysteine ligase 2 n=1 Tax=Variibacter gotjawalensis TaxID=1333996 RepID=A0A0S3PY86_9BRAD|nr:carboxylate-amine ligase [Variibacter gotjawalensis]NIK46712.1 carboxylate-amine ligase [Variibacter gotjawalensis]RZS48615.1 carboxylate-amine ligase [Variibacter gotjawalensis]BAT60877.1 carboxylate-amine ligase YbdK [Variibacter gotjawalensis]
MPEAYQMGVEEEYFLFDRDSRRAILRRDKRFIAVAKKRLGDRVMPEMLQSQIEAITTPCSDNAALREQLAEGRTILSEEAKNRDLGIAAVSTFPLAYWRLQKQTPKERYNTLMEDLQMIGRRNMLCGMHVHVGFSDTTRRVAVMQQVVPYLPLFLALSTSSPFWEGGFTGLHGYRLAAYDEMPRTGLPARMSTEQEYESYVAALVDAGIMPDASHIWWAIRPSLKHPTLELRVADVCTNIDDAVALATLYRAMVRHFDVSKNGRTLDSVGRAITIENKWRAQRYGVGATFVDPFPRKAIAAADWLDQTLDLLAADFKALESEDMMPRLRDIARNGTSADRQIEKFNTAREAGQPTLTAMKSVVDWASEETARV